jgi:SAM-dependent methyltransferase
MKVRESGMPEEAYWETLFDVPLILDRLGIDARLKNVVELGCGYGTFTVPVARRISGTVTAFDIDEAMVERTRQRAAAAGTYKVLYIVRDVFADGFGGEAGSKDACLLFNILHCEEPVRLLAEAARVVRSALLDVDSVEALLVGGGRVHEDVHGSVARHCRQRRPLGRGQ